MTALTTKAGVPWQRPSSPPASLPSSSASLLGFPALRVQKHYLAFVTLAFAMLVWLILRNEQWLTGGVIGHQQHPAALAVRRLS